MDEEKYRRDAKNVEAAQFPESIEEAGNIEAAGLGDSAAAPVKAWELMDADVGRYMPRRIRGSFRGRALG